MGWKTKLYNENVMDWLCEAMHSDEQADAAGLLPPEKRE